MYVKAVFVLVLGAALALTATADYDWSLVDSVLESAIKDGAFPGCTAIVANKQGILYSRAFGNYTYGKVPPYTPAGEQGESPPVQLNTQFDMASCTKVVSTTSAVALLYQAGLLDLNTRIADPYLLGPKFAANGKGDITVLNCLLHNAGYPPDPNPNYWFPEFGCPQTTKPEPAETFGCRDRIYDSLLNQTLARPPGEKYVYSDLSFITLMWVVGRVVQQHAQELRITAQDLLPGCASPSASSAQCFYEAFVRLHVFEPLNMKSTKFLPALDEWANCAPAENDTVYLRRVVQGQVSDGNAYALGGISGHAGLFSTALDVHQLMHQLMFEQDTGLLNATTMALFTKEYNHTQSSRALGWNTNDPTVFDEGWNCSCGTLSAKTYMHLGYTGTQICADPVNEVLTIFLTNRVYPTAANYKIERVRQLYNQAVVKTLGIPPSTQLRRPDSTYMNTVEAEYADWQHRPVTPPSANTSVIPYEYPLFKQCNASWGSQVMVKETICQVGCLMSSISMSLRGKHIMIDSNYSNPSTLNYWLEHNHGYVGEDDLVEGVIPNINPKHITWVGSKSPDALSRAQVVEMLEDTTYIVIINVMHGQHFVLVTGYDTVNTDVWYVNDPGFNRQTYTREDVVGYRIFQMLPVT